MAPKAVRADEGDNGRKLMPPSLPVGATSTDYDNLFLDKNTNTYITTGNKVYRIGYASGTQNYVCLPTQVNGQTTYSYQLYQPYATLFNRNSTQLNEDVQQIMTHFFGNPDSSGKTPVTTNTLLPAWQDSMDSSTVWGTKGQPYTPDPANIPWFLITITRRQTGPTGGTRLTDTTYVQRVYTSVGVATKTDCVTSSDVGNKDIEPYSAAYYFWKAVTTGY